MTTVHTSAFCSTVRAPARCGGPPRDGPPAGGAEKEGQSGGSRLRCHIGHSVHRVPSFPGNTIPRRSGMGFEVCFDGLMASFDALETRGSGCALDETDLARTPISVLRYRMRRARGFCLPLPLRRRQHGGPGDQNCAVAAAAGGRGAGQARLDAGAARARRVAGAAFWAAPGEVGGAFVRRNA